jgi:hypothetical protein
MDSYKEVRGRDRAESCQPRGTRQGWEVRDLLYENAEASHIGMLAVTALLVFEG